MSDVPRPTVQTAPQREAPPRPGRDFSEDQKESFRYLSASMSFVGACLLLFGGLLAVFAAVAAYAGFPWGGLGLLVAAAAYGPAGWWTTSAGRSLSGIVRTRGGDVDHLMDAVAQLRRLFAFARGVIIVQTLVSRPRWRGVSPGARSWRTRGTRCFNLF